MDITNILRPLSIIFPNKFISSPDTTSCCPVFVGEMRRILNLLARFVNLRALFCHRSTKRQSVSPCCCRDQSYHIPTTIAHNTHTRSDSHGYTLTYVCKGTHSNTHGRTVHERCNTATYIYSHKTHSLMLDAVCFL